MKKTLWCIALVLAAFVVLPAQACYYLVLPVHVSARGGCGGPTGGGGGTSPPPPATISASINLDTVYTGQTPAGAAPWLKAAFSSTVGASSGTLTLTSSLSGADGVRGLVAAGWAFYLTDAVSSISYVSGTQASLALYVNNISTGPVPGAFNLAFNWPPGGAFKAGDQATYDLTFADPLTSNPFAANADGWSSTAFVQDTDYPACGAWIVAGSGAGADGGSPCVTTTSPQADVPEPAELGMFGFGLLLIGGFVGVGRRWV